MKEWCMKHPLLTYLIIDEVITMLENVLLSYKRRKAGVAEKASSYIEDTVTRIAEKCESEAAESKQPIGFAV